MAISERRNIDQHDTPTARQTSAMAVTGDSDRCGPVETSQ